MSDNRPALEPVEAIAALQRKVEDLASTTAARLVRRPTGDIEPTLRSTAKPDTLLLDGATISRETYPALWAWVSENGLAPSVFGAGDGTTTFTLPDLRGKVAVGATSVDPLGTTFGAATTSVPLTEANFPAHNHDELTGWGGDHDHGGATGGNGDHPGHVIGVSTATHGTGPTRNIPGDSQTDGHHSHGIGGSGNHKHGIPTWGSSNPAPLVVSTIQPSYALNWIIWT